MTAAKAPFAKMTSQMKTSRPLRIMVLGQGGVGKSALVVRFITRRYIGEYDPTLEKLYSFHTLIDNEMAHLDILDTAGQPHETECPTLEANIRWAEAFVLMYSVTDKCSFDECNRLKFLINYNKRRRRLSSAKVDAPVVLVGNKTDQHGDRMVSFEEGRRRCIDIGCVSFHEISVREHIDEVWDVFRDVVRCYRALGKGPKLKRSSSELPGGHDASAMSGDSLRYGHSQTSPGVAPALGRRWTEVGPEDVEEGEEERRDRLLPFRDRASTDGTLFSRPRRRWRYPSCTTPAARAPLQDQLADRRMSISMRGNSSAY